jgi:L-iditol 2-dehydrogenase
MGNILPAPESLPSEYAAPAEPGSSVIHAQERAGISLGDNVLVIGTGPIGCLHASVARARGAKRIVLADLVQERLDMGGEFPVDGLINTAKEDIHRASEKYFGPRGPDVIITAAPAAEIQVLAAELIGKGGRIIFFGGLPHGNSKPGIDTNLIHYKNASIIGTSIFAPRHFRMSLEMIETGQIPVEKLVTHILPLRNFNRGVELAAAGKALKVVYKNNGR